MSISNQSPFSPWRRLQTLLDVEIALAEALADAGVIPTASLPPIRVAAKAERYDLAALDAEAKEAGNPVIPLVRHLTRLVAEDDEVAAGYVHWGATSQDIMDTALVLQLRSAGAGIVETLGRAADQAATLADTFAATPIAGRTWLQQATPTTFGAKAVAWMQGLDRAQSRLDTALEAARDLQFGGATGTLSFLGEAGPVVANALATRLGLRPTDAAWHTERSRVTDIACALGLACGALGKIARDLALLSQTEVGEVSEPSEPCRGSSSSMPHKRNPVSSAKALAAAVQAPGLVATMLAAMPQEHERAIGGWQAEWDTLPALTMLTADAATAMADALTGLEVNAARMRANLDAAAGVARAEGLMAALARRIGRVEAARVVEQTCRRALAQRRALAEVAADDPAIRAHLDANGITNALDPDTLTITARDLVRRTLHHRRSRSKGAHHG
jgi:3-carboxy-cis,cis-muconate cycloisomerase